MSKIYYIAGTDTGVGKTTVAAALAAFLHASGRHVGVFKPLETGCTENPQGLVAQDAMFLLAMSQSPQTPEEVCLYPFLEPLAPAVAAKRAGVKIDFDKIVGQVRELARRFEVVLVEGAGGLLVPWDDTHFFVDLIQQQAGEVILVARLGLGTINHTLLSLEALDRRHIACRAVVLNQNLPELDLAARTNPEVLRERAGPCLAVFPYLDQPDQRRDLLRGIAAIAQKIGLLGHL